MTRPTVARPTVALRVHPARALTGARMRMAGGGRKFGIDEDALAPLVQRILAEDRVELRGLHVYAGTQNFDARAWLEGAEELVAITDRLEAATGWAARSLNFGGGFGVATSEGDPDFDLAAAGEGLQRLLADAPAGRTHAVELGRYLVARAGVYLTRVVHVKRAGGREHRIVDGGLQHLAAAAGYGAVIRRTWPIVAADRPFERGAPTGLGGPLCTPADEFGGEVDLPPLAAGDVVAVLNAGAYGLTFSPVLFLGHPLPAELLVDDGRVFVAREAGRPADVLRGQHVPDAAADGGSRPS